MTPALEVSELGFELSAGVPALRGVSFSVEAGECVAIIGPNGAGKSTLLLHLNGILPELANDRSRGSVRVQRVARALSQVGLSGFERRMPNRLSGGEKKRVCLAGLLAYEPSILVLDEPSAGLDPRGRRELIAR